MRTATCKSCGAEIVWIATASGKRMPCDAAPAYYRQTAAGGKSRIVTPDGVVLSCEITKDPGMATGTGFIPHWATCPQADSHRKRKPTKD